MTENQVSTGTTLTVITPSFNQGPFIERTIESVLSQGIVDLEYMVVDGGSSDETVEILKRYDGRLQWLSEPDDGQADAVNKGLARTRGDIICWLNSDDVYYPGALQRVRAYLDQHPEIDVVYGDAHHIDEQDQVIERYYTEPWNPQRLTEVCYLCQPAVFFRRKVVERCGPLGVSLYFCLDYEYWLRIERQGARFAYLERYLAGSRFYATNKTLSWPLRSHTEINDMLRRTLGSVPDRWLSNWAHALLRQRGASRESSPLAFASSASLWTWFAALRWNRWIRASLWRTTWQWIAAANQERRDRRRAESTERVVAHSSRRESPMEIGYDVSQTGPRKAGCGVVADALLKALVSTPDDNLYTLYPTFGDRYQNPEGAEATLRIDRPNVRVGPIQPSPESASVFWREPALEERLDHPDIIHSHNFFCPPNLADIRLVYTVYDLAPLLHPEWTTEENRQVCFEGLFDASLSADLIVAISEATRRDFLETFPHYPEERVRVVHLASRFTGEAPSEAPPACSRFEPDRFHLAVGMLEPRKNHLRLLQAYASHVAKTENPLPLVLAGGQGWLVDDLSSQIEALGITPLVHPVGHVDDDCLAWLYRHCFAFYYPSLFEGFGLPPLEAMSFGAAVVTSRVSSLPEVVGETALLVDPTDVGDIEDAMNRLSREPELRQRLREQAPERAALFSWKKAAEDVLECYRQVLEMDKYASPRRGEVSDTVGEETTTPTDPHQLGFHGTGGVIPELEEVRADQQAKEALIQRIAAELEEVRADQQAKETVIAALARDRPAP